MLVVKRRIAARAETNLLNDLASDAVQHIEVQRVQVSTIQALLHAAWSRSESHMVLDPSVHV